MELIDNGAALMNTAENNNIMNKILRTGNLTDACYEVVYNKGSAGVDKMQVSELKAYLDKNRTMLEDLIRNNQYQPQPIRGKEPSVSELMSTIEKLKRKRINAETQR